jgi:hypothetical protein
MEGGLACRTSGGWWSAVGDVYPASWDGDHEPFGAQDAQGLFGGAFGDPVLLGQHRDRGHRLRRRHTALRVSKVTEVAVRGSLYQPWHANPKPTAAVAVYLDDWRTNWLLAGQLIVALQQFTVTTLDARQVAARRAQ